MPRIRTLLFIALAALAAVPARATVFERGGPVSVIDTAHCAFVFPEECRADAERLAANADSIYAEVVAFVGTDPDIHFNVLVSADSELLGGSMLLIPPNDIVLYRAPPVMAAEHASLEDSLLAVFRHELTHAVSLCVKSGFWSLMCGLFGDVLSPSFWWMGGPELMEGVTVASESDTGFGRANDPLVLLAIRQDILEGRARTVQEARGGDDDWPGGSTHYWYGGVFTVWLRQAYGTEKYAELWRELGKGNAFVGTDGWLFFPGAFEKVYGLSLDAAWGQFITSAAYTRPVVTAVRRLREEPGKITAMASRGKDLYWGDSAAGVLFKRDGDTGVTRGIARVDYLLTGISAAEGSSRLLLSEGRFTNSGSSVHLFVREWDEQSRAWVGPEHPDLREAAWVGNDGSAFAAVGVRGGFSDLVLVRDGRRETLLEGSWERQVASPVPLRDGSIAFLLREKGITRVARISPATRAVEVLECEQPLGVIRTLSASGDGLAFSWATREDFPSLAILDSSGLRVQATALSGGVTWPVQGASDIFYVGRFSDGMRPCAYPADLPDLSLRPADSRWVAHEIEAEAAAAPIASRPYSFLPSLVPWLRVPFPKIGVSGLEGAGVFLMSMDPMQSWLLTTAADYDWTRTFADVSLSLSLMPPSTTIGVSLSDQAAWDSVESVDVRTVTGSLSGTYAAYLAPELASLSVGLDVSLSARAPESSSASTAYAWPFESLEGSVGVDASYDGRVRRSLDTAVRTTGFGILLALDAGSPIGADFLPGAAAQCEAAFSVGALGLEVEAWAAATLPGVPGMATLGLFPAGIYRDGAARSGITTRYPEFREYSSFVPQAADSWLYGYFDANWMPLAADVMKDVQVLKMFLTRIGVSVGYRGAVAGMTYLDAAYFRLALQGGMDQGSLAGSLLCLYAEISYALRASATGVAEYSYGFGVKTSL